MAAEALATLLEKQRAFAAAHPLPDARARRDNLDRLVKAITSHEDAILQALEQDLGKCAIEAYTSELGFVLRDASFAMKRLRRWMKPRRVHVPMMAHPARAVVAPEPVGVVLIVGPWNYPFQLVFSPLIAALAAGNAVCVKPSEFAPGTAEVTRSICATAFTDDHVAVVLGESEVASQLTSLPYDHIMFTGSTTTGRKVAAAAAKNLVPVTLELGGKSPCVVCEDCDLAKTAKRIMWGKIVNAGQTCVAPDYVLAHESITADLLNELKNTARTLVPHRPPEQSRGDYGRIVNRKHYDRLVQLLESAEVFDGGERDNERLALAPAILTGVDWDHPVMQEEIFGPLLPVLSFQALDEAIVTILERPRPLAAYLFTREKATMQQFRQKVKAGGIAINDTVVHTLPPDLPFGGVGESGHGRYRGRAGFETFSNPKAVLTRSQGVEFSGRYPPYTTSLGVIKRAYRWIAR